MMLSITGMGNKRSVRLLVIVLCCLVKLATFIEATESNSEANNKDHLKDPVTDLKRLNNGARPISNKLASAILDEGASANLNSILPNIFATANNDYDSGPSNQASTMNSINLPTTSGYIAVSGNSVEQGRRRFDSDGSHLQQLAGNSQLGAETRDIWAQNLMRSASQNFKARQQRQQARPDQAGALRPMLEANNKLVRRQDSAMLNGIVDRGFKQQHQRRQQRPQANNLRQESRKSQAKRLARTKADGDDFFNDDDDESERNKASSDRRSSSEDGDEESDIDEDDDTERVESGQRQAKKISKAASGGNKRSQSGERDRGQRRRQRQESEDETNLKSDQDEGSSIRAEGDEDEDTESSNHLRKETVPMSEEATGLQGQQQQEGQFLGLGESTGVSNDLNDPSASHVKHSSTDLQAAAGSHHGHHDHYYQHVEVPKKKSWKFGFKRGNHKHTIERHEKGHKHKFHSSFKWHAKEKCKKKKKCKSVGKMTWEYKHAKKHHG